MSEQGELYAAIQNAASDLADVCADRDGQIAELKAKIADLLDTLKAFIAHWGGRGFYCSPIEWRSKMNDMCNAARAVIAKAEGGE